MLLIINNESVGLTLSCLNKALVLIFGCALEIENITVIGGNGRDGSKEPLAGFDLNMGDVVSIVGPTGSGKTALINDIGLFADGNTQTKRRVLINDAPPRPEFMEDPSKNPIALITQHTSFLSDLPVHKFLGLHAKIRKVGRPGTLDRRCCGDRQLPHHSAG